MGKPNIIGVIRALSNAGFRTERAFPGQRMPSIQMPAVAVSIYKDEQDQHTLDVTVLSPERLGGETCEDTAIQVAGVLRKQGYRCLQEHCRYDGKGDRFLVRILAEWQPAALKDVFTVTVAGYPHPWAVSVTVQQKTDLRPVAEMGQSEPAGYCPQQGKWEITLEEQLPPDISENEDPQEPFDLLIRRAAVGEHFEQCRWIKQSRKDTKEGLYLQRTAVAATRSLIDYG